MRLQAFVMHTASHKVVWFRTSTKDKDTGYVMYKTGEKILARIGNESPAMMSLFHNSKHHYLEDIHLLLNTRKIEKFLGENPKSNEIQPFYLYQITFLMAT